MINADGAKVSYDVKISSLETTGEDKETNLNFATPSADFDANGNGLITGLIKLKVDADGEVTEVWKTESGTSFVKQDLANKYKTDVKYVENHRVKSGTVVFLIEEFLKSGDEDDIKVVKWSDIEDFEEIYKDIDVTGVTYRSEVYYDDEDYATHIVAVRTDLEDDYDNVKAIVTDISTVKGSDNEYRIKALVDGAEKTYYTKEGTSISSAIRTAVRVDGYDLVTLAVHNTSELVKTVSALTANTDYKVETVTTRSVSDDEINGYKLVDDAYVYDATDSTDIEKISLRDIAIGDQVILVLDRTGTSFVKYVILDEEASDDDDDDVVTDYELKTFTKTSLTISGFVYDEDDAENNKFIVRVIGDSQDQFGTATVTSTDDPSDEVAFSGITISGGKIYTVELYYEKDLDTVLGTWKKFVPSS
jgi:hypothetical protein